jgi:hypothetical protein
MSLATLLQLPAFVMLAIAAVCLVLAAAIAAGGRRYRGIDGRRYRSGASAALRALVALLLFSLALVIAAGGWMLRGYRVLDNDITVLGLTAHAQGPQHWTVDLSFPGGKSRTVELNGDAFRVEAVVVKWKTPAMLAGAPPLFRLDRLSGRYDDAGQEASTTPVVVPLAEHDGWDFLDLSHRYPQWLPQVDTVFGSGAYLPLADGGHYTVSLMRTGALVARTDDMSPPVK